MAGDELQAQRGIIPGSVRLRPLSLQLLLVVPLRAASWSTASHFDALVTTTMLHRSSSSRANGSQTHAGKKSKVRARLENRKSQEYPQQVVGAVWLFTTCCWVSCLVPSALPVWIVFLGKFCVRSLVHVAPGSNSCPFSPSFFFLQQQRCVMFC